MSKDPFILKARETYWIRSYEAVNRGLANASFADSSNFQHLSNIWHQLMSDISEIKISSQIFQHQNQLPGLVAEISFNFNICPILDISWCLTYMKLKYLPKYLIIQSFQHQNQLPGLVAEIMLNFQHLSNICPILDISWWLACLKLKFLPQYVIRWSFWHQNQPPRWSGC